MSSKEKPALPPVVMIQWYDDWEEQESFWSFGYICRKLSDSRVMVAFTTNFQKEDAWRVWRVTAADNPERRFVIEQRPQQPDASVELWFMVVNTGDYELLNPLPDGALPTNDACTALSYRCNRPTMSDMALSLAAKQQGPLYDFAPWTNLGGDPLEVFQFEGGKEIFTPTHDRELLQMMADAPVITTSLPMFSYMNGSPVWSSNGYLLGLLYKPTRLSGDARMLLVRARNVMQLAKQLG